MWVEQIQTIIILTQNNLMKKPINLLIFILLVASTITNAQETQYLSMSPNLIVKDMKVSQEFYTKTLGFQLIDQEPKDADPVWMMLAYNEITFMLQTQESLGEEIPSLKNEKTGATLIFYITVNNIKDYYDKVSKGSKVISDLKVTFYGATEFSIEDPDGYILTFAEFPKETTN